MRCAKHLNVEALTALVLQKSTQAVRQSARQQSTTQQAHSGGTAGELLLLCRAGADGACV